MSVRVSDPLPKKIDYKPSEDDLKDEEENHKMWERIAQKARRGHSAYKKKQRPSAAPAAAATATTKSQQQQQQQHDDKREASRKKR